MSDLWVYHPLLPPEAGKNIYDRLNPFLQWLNAGGRHWLAPDLGAYRDYLLERLSPESAASHLATIRGQYKKMLKSNVLRDNIYAEFPPDLPFTERKARVEEVITRLENAVDPAHSTVKVVTAQDDDRFRLSVVQVQELIDAPGTEDITGIRDTALLRLLLATGVREEECANLHVEDIGVMWHGDFAVYVRKGKGAKSRYIPLGGLAEWVLPFVDDWLDVSGITEGVAFRGLWKSGAPRPTGLNKRSIGYIVGKYTIQEQGERRSVTPHELRYTYARRLYDTGLSVERIQANLGHKSQKTTLDYIGELNPASRRPDSGIWG